MSSIFKKKGAKKKKEKKKKRSRNESNEFEGSETCLRMLQLEVLVGKVPAVDGVAPPAVATNDVPSLNHEPSDDAMELGPLIMQGLPTGPYAHSP